MIEKCRIMYKGDVIASMFYIFIGFIFFVCSLGLYYFTISAGFQYLSIGLFMFFIYSTGKGISLYLISKKSLAFYSERQFIDSNLMNEEIKHTEFRLQKKQTNRRVYIYVTVISCLIAFLGIFSPFKSIMMGTAIPVALISAIEFSIGLLTEFRLREYHRVLNNPNPQY